MTSCNLNEIQRYQVNVIKKALELYVKSGIQVNRMYTPKNMMATASVLTGKKFKARDYKGAIEALGELL